MPNASFLSLALLTFSAVLAGLPARGIPSMRITQPAEGAIVTTAPFAAMAVAEGFQPAWAGLMERVTAADGTVTTRALPPQAWGYGTNTFTFETVTLDDGPHVLYVYALDGETPVFSPDVRMSVRVQPRVSVSFYPNPVTACRATTAVLRLTPAPTSERTVTISADAAGLGMPAVVTVPGNKGEATFQITPGPQRAARDYNIRFTEGTDSRVFQLSVLARPHYTYEIEEISGFGGPESRAFGINASGRWTGFTTDASGTRRGFRTNAAGLAEALAPSLAAAHTGMAINSAGQVAGYTLSGTMRAFISTPNNAGVVTVPILSGAVSMQALGINNLGSAAGFYTDAGGATHGFRTDPLGNPTVVGNLTGGTQTAAFAINDAGQIAGHGTMSGGRVHAMRVEANGARTDLGTLGGLYSYGYGINEAGQVAGLSLTASGVYHVFRTATDGKMQDLGSLRNSHTAGRAINRYGDVAGEVFSFFNGQPTPESAVLYTDSLGLVDLNAHIDPSLYWTLVSAADINDAGQIVGYGYRDYDYAPRAFRLTPTVPRAVYGDADGDGAVTVRDATSILRASAGLGPAVNFLAADVAPAACSAKGFGDGLADIADAIRVLRHVLSPEPVWP